MRLLSCIESMARVDIACRALVRLPRYVSEWGMNKPAREVARSLCGHLDGAVRLHRNTQEGSLFPALLASVDNVDGLATVVARFIAEHKAIETAWRALRPSLTAIALCRPTKLSIPETTWFAGMYRDHATVEARHLVALAPRFRAALPMRLTNELRAEARHT